MTPEFLQEIRMLILKGDRIEAKTLLFQYFGNLTEANAFLESMPQSVTFQNHDVIAFLQKGEALNAVKLVRSLTGWDLRTSKEYADNLREELGL